MSGQTGMFGNDPTDYSTEGGGSVQALIDASSGVNSGWSFNLPKSSETASTSAIQSMTPVTSSGAASDSGFSLFWRGLAGSIVNTGVAVVAQKNGLVQPASTTPVVAVPPSNPNGMLLLLALGVGVVLLATHKG